MKEVLGVWAPTFVAKATTNWESTNDTIGLSFSFLTDQFNDSLSQGELSEDQIYVINMGLDNDYNPMGFMVLKVNRTPNGIILKCKDLEGEDEFVNEIDKDDFYTLK